MITLTESTPPTASSAAVGWLREIQTKATERLALCPPPTRTDEAWRFANLKHLEQLEQFQPASGIGTDGAGSDPILASLDHATRVRFVNDQLVSDAEELASQLPEGATCLPLNQAIESHPDLVRKHFMREANRAGSERYALLHQAHLSNGLLIHLAAGVELDAPILIDHQVSGDGVAVYPHLLVVAEDNAKVTVIEGLRSANQNDSGFSLGVCDLVAGPGSHVAYLQLQKLNETSFAMQLNSGVAARDAHVTTGFINLGGRWVRQVSTTRLLEPGADSRMISVNLGHEQQEIDQRTLQSHEAENTYSDLLYKNVLDDRARSIFSGLIQVQHGAHNTDAYQKCRNLLLSDTAEANSMPGLEINADQVKCSHGATAGAIDPEQMFYLRSRGLETEAAEHLIALGFAVETLDAVPDKDLRQALTQEIEQVLLQRDR